MTDGAFTVDIRLRPGYLHVVVDGNYDHRQFREDYIRVLKTAITEKLSKIVLDCLTMSGSPTMAERMDIAALAGDYRFEVMLAGQPASHKVAFVVTPQAKSVNSAGVAFAKPRGGGTAEVFTRLEDALQWLGVTQEGG